MTTDKRRIIWDPNDDPTHRGAPEHFRRYAEAAAASGATHVCISRLPFSRWQMDNPRDPHPEWASWPVWSMVNASLFKVVVPPALAEWLPVDEARRNLDLIRERSAILRGLGLRATFQGIDPMWLPEEVFLAHPKWRGAQAELPVIARLSYFSPCIDHPEVLEMFRWSMAELCRTAPEIDLYSVFTNDSASAVCWTMSYPGPNGALACKDRPLTERIGGFLSALQQGARDAGQEIDVHLTNVPKVDYHTVLQPGQYVNGVGLDGASLASHVSGNCWFGNHLYPVVGVPKVFTFAREYEEAFRADNDRAMVIFGPAVEDLLQNLYRFLQAHPPKGLVGRMVVLREFAATLVGDDRADDLVDAWARIEQSVDAVRHICGKGYASLLLVGPAMMRWLTMPLVPDISRIHPEDKAIFQRWRVAKNQVEADSYHALLGLPGITGSAAVWLARNSLNKAERSAQQAADLVAGLLDAAVNEQVRAEFELLVSRLKALRAVYISCRNVIEYEEALAQRSPEEEQVQVRDITGTYTINRASYDLRLIARAELDNVYELAELIENAPAPLIAQTTDPAEEDSFVFGPDLVAQLRQKARIMLEHWPEYNELYPPQDVVHARQAIHQGDQRDAVEGELLW